MSNAVTQLAKIIKSKLVRTVNGGAPDATGNVNLPYMARQDKTNIFSARQTFAGGVLAVSIQPNSSMDDIKQAGYYSQMTNSNVATIKNSPFSTGFYMLVFDGNKYTYQLAFEYSGNAISQRVYDYMSDVWSDWTIIGGLSVVTDLQQRIAKLEAR